jgi:hypothetical protein
MGSDTIPSIDLNPTWISPEFLAEGSKRSLKGDVYSFGMTIYVRYHLVSFLLLISIDAVFRNCLLGKPPSMTSGREIQY